MRFGVNYTPRDGWFHHWVDYNPDEVARDFDTIKELGVDHIRVFPLWPVFQPNPSMVSASSLNKLENLLVTAAQRGLEVSVDGLQGHLSSFDYLPAWLTSWHKRNMFTDAYAVESTARFLGELASVSAQHENVFAFTLGNEINQFTGGVHPHPDPATPQNIDAWLDAMFAATRAAAPNLMHLHACYDASWYEETQPFTLEHVARQGDASVVHSWVFNGTAQKYGPDAFETRAHARYMVELARAFHTDPTRKIWAQELGAPRNVLPEQSIPAFVDATIEQLAAAPDLMGITWWCSHDVSRKLADFPELEYDLGLIDEHGVIKPVGKQVAQAVAEAQRTISASPPQSSASSIQLDLEAIGGRTALRPGGAFWNDYMDAARGGDHPRITLAQNGTGATA